MSNERLKEISETLKKFDKEYEEYKKHEESLKDKEVIHFRKIGGKKGLAYSDFIRDNFTIPELENGDKKLGLRTVAIKFNYPTSLPVTFTISSRNEFTVNEIALKVMKHYHLIVYLYKNYDLNKGCVTSNDMIGENTITNDFHKLFHPTLGEYEYDNKVTRLEYNKKDNVWLVIFKEYI